MNLKEEFEEKFCINESSDEDSKMMYLNNDISIFDAWSWIENKIKEACNLQKEICDSIIGTNWLDPIYNEYIKDNNVEALLRKIKTAIKSAPYPEGIEK